MRKNGVQCLLMGGQACVLYGGAEFSRDTDFALLSDDANLDRLSGALRELSAERIAVPPFEKKYLDMGLAVHFRCRHPDAARMRLDLMSKMRGVDKFPVLWERRTTIEADEPIDLISLPDLVRAKKTQRDKDWPMIARLLEANYFRNQAGPTPEQIDFWLRELRTPTLLIEAAERFSAEAQAVAADRPAVAMALAKDEAAVREELSAEEEREREADRQYWRPLKETLQDLRRAARGDRGP
ncbi:MAG: hypothetical protein KY475_04075 [Planctomycetes bacterium]|nr:hypothetical protein [Planctomycetota bacterium]